MADNLRDYFEQSYREGGTFERGDYDFLPEEWCWLHKRTGIKVWADALDLAKEGDARVVFHYTDELAFRRIVGGKAAEVWASLVPSSGSGAARGVYTVPKPPDEWQDRQELLENNYRQTMRRHREDLEKGEDYVAKAYPLKVAHCVPILVSATKAQEGCKDPGPKAKPSVPPPPRKEHKDVQPRHVVMLRFVDGEGAVSGATCRLLETLRIRAKSSQQKGEKHVQTLLAKSRLGAVLLQQGLRTEAEPLLRELLAACEETCGSGHPRTLSAAHSLARLSVEQGELAEAKRLLRRAVKDSRKKSTEPNDASPDSGADMASAASAAETASAALLCAEELGA
ncbi:unnamed protein product, partial [Effrenium voratum]